MKYIGEGLLWRQGPPDIYGQPTFGTPEVIKHRWERRAGMFINGQGRQETYNSRVYINTVPNTGDRVAETTSGSLDCSYEIKDVRQIFSVSGKKNEVRVLL